MGDAKYILTRYERILRVEKVEYTIEIPEEVTNKLAYAEEQLLGSKYVACKVVDIPDSEILDEETRSLRKGKSKK